MTDSKSSKASFQATFQAKARIDAPEKQRRIAIQISLESVSILLRGTPHACKSEEKGAATKGMGAQGIACSEIVLTLLKNIHKLSLAIKMNK
jgi:hypothetical protein